MSDNRASAGRFLRVDLTTGESAPMDTTSHARRLVGGRGVASAIYFDEVPPAVGFDDPRNRLILSVGPLCGMHGGLGGSRWGIYGKSPLPAPAHGGRDHFCYGNLGGSFGAELRFAGYDGVVLQGQAERPVSLAIDDDRVQILPAEDVWGTSTVHAMAALLARATPGSRAMAIGPAGENRVPIATVFADGDASCSGGMGAVMGAKRLKGITVRGSRRKVPIADPRTLRDIDRQIRACQRGNVKVWGMDFMAHGPRTRKMPCFGCMAHCLRVRYRADNGASGKFMCQSRFFYMNHAWGYYGEDNDVPFHANRLCDEYGVDTWEVQALIEWLLLCHAGGLIPESESGLDLKQVGSLELIENLVRMVSLRQGPGELLCHGALGAAQARGGPSEAVFTRTDPYDPRYCPVNTLLFPFETREPIQQLHEAGLVLSQWSSWAKGVEEAHISSDVMRGIARRFWGSEAAADMSTLQGKAGAAKRIQERQFAKECVGLCDWMFPLIDVPHPTRATGAPKTAEDHVGDPSFESRILSAAVGTPYSEADLYRVGERAFNLQRAILLREGHRARDDDFLPREWHLRPIETHVADPDLLAPGRRGEVMSQVGRRVDHAGFLRLRDEYYQLRGWDVPTGLPSRQQLRALDLGGVADDLMARGLAVERARGVPLVARLRHGVTALRQRFEGQCAPQPVAPAGESVQGEALLAILIGEQLKFGSERVRHNFAGWNKTMQYYFPDIDQHWVIRFVDGEAQPPERLDGPARRPEIGYEMASWTLRAMAAGELSGEKAYFTRKLRMKSSFSDMMKLQSLNKL